MSNSPNKLYVTLYDAAKDSFQRNPKTELGASFKHLFSQLEISHECVQFELASSQQHNYADIYGVNTDGKDGLKIYAFSVDENDERVAAVCYSMEDAMKALFKNLVYKLRDYKYMGRSDQDGLSYGKIYSVKQIDVIKGIPTEMFIDDDNDLRPVTFQSSKELSLVPQSTL